jgi:hypothetical protein
MASFSLSKWRFFPNRKPRIDAPHMLQDFVQSYSPHSAPSTVTLGFYLFLSSNQAQNETFYRTLTDKKRFKGRISHLKNRVL